MAKQMKKMNEGGSSTGFNARTGKQGVTTRTANEVSRSNTNTTNGQKLSYKKGGSVAATKKRK